MVRGPPPPTSQCFRQAAILFLRVVAYEWISIFLPINKLPSVLTDYVREPIERREATRITTKQSTCHHLVQVATKTAKSKLRWVDSPAACRPESTEDELIDALSKAITTAKDGQ